MISYLGYRKSRVLSLDFSHNSLQKYRLTSVFQVRFEVRFGCRNGLKLRIAVCEFCLTVTITNRIVSTCLLGRLAQR